jgi:hypothetical protein
VLAKFAAAVKVPAPPGAIAVTLNLPELSVWPVAAAPPVRLMEIACPATPAPAASVSKSWPDIDKELPAWTAGRELSEIEVACFATVSTTIELVAFTAPECPTTSAVTETEPAAAELYTCEEFQRPLAAEIGIPEEFVLSPHKTVTVSSELPDAAMPDMLTASIPHLTVGGLAEVMAIVALGENDCTRSLL